MSPITPAPSHALIAVVLGGSEGIGAAMVSHLAAAGHPVVAVARTAGPLEESCRRIDPSGERVVGLAIDLTADDASERIDEIARRSFGCAPSIIVQSASIFRAGPLSAVDDDELEMIFTSNVSRPFRTIRRLVDRIPGPGHVIVVNSTAGLRLNPNSAAYSASQMAVRALTDALREDVNPRGVRVTSIFPGRTDTRLHRQVLEYEGIEFDPDVVLQPSDVADAAMVALSTSDRAEIVELVVRPSRKPAG